MSHTTDSIGYPLDPELRRLEFRLGDLAAAWRGAYGDTVYQESIRSGYHAIMSQLYALGWDSALDIESELPDAELPEEYLRRNPRF